jgi:mannosyltransferase OCH1-like enzyme
MAAETGGGIQRIIHQIWLGTNPMPNEWMDSVKDFAAKYNYEYKVWTDANITDIHMSPELRAEYDSFGSELAGRADIIRLIVLNTYGGIYIDADSVILKPEKFAKFLDENKASVFFAWEEMGKDIGNMNATLAGEHSLVSNGTIGAKKGHPFIEKLITDMVNNSKGMPNRAAWKRVGPLYVTRMYKEHKKEFPDIHIYPMKYFYPLKWHGITDPELHKKIDIPEESMLFQYGYSTNNFAEIFAKRNQSGAGNRKRSRKRSRKSNSKRLRNRKRSRKNLN